MPFLDGYPIIQLLGTLIQLLMLQKILTITDRHKSPPLRNMSLLQYRPEVTIMPRDLNEFRDLTRLEKYIGSNIKSERRSVLSLYSTSYKVLQGSKRPILPNIEVSNRGRALKPKSHHSITHEPRLSTILFPLNENPDQNPDVIISNHFSSTISKTLPKKEVEITKQIKWLMPTKISQIEKPKEILVQQQKTIQPRLHYKEQKKKRKQKSKKVDNDQLNPWEYLRFQDEISINQLP